MDTGISSSRFGVMVRNYLIEKNITRRNGSPNWQRLVEMLPQASYETLRKAVTGERSPAPALMEAVAVALDIEPGEFSEYRLWRYRRQFDPAAVGFEQAVANLNRVEAV